MKIIAPFLLLLGILPLLNCDFASSRSITSDSLLRKRLRREVPYVRTVRRASLHELLKMNGNVASVSEKSEGRRQVDDPPTTSDIDENRRLLVVGDADEPPNYIDDDGVTSDKKLNDYDIDTNDQDKSSGHSAKKTKLGTPVTKYSNPFSSASAPSYADPELLTAVMKQADKANFRFPSQNTPSQYKRDPNVSAALKKASEVSSTRKDENPYKKLFPPQFHELLDIPMHIYRNGSAKLTSSKTSEPNLQAPKITGGYANTNINSPSNANPERERVSEEILEKGTTGESYANFKPAVRRPFKPTTNVRQQNSQNGIRQKPIYTEVVRKPNGAEDRIPPTDPSRLPEKKTERPFLQFRTKASAAVIPTEEPAYIENEFYTESASLDISLPPGDEREVSNSIKTTNRYYIQEGIRVTPIPPLNSQTNLKTVNTGYQSDFKQDDIGFGSKISEDLGKSKEQAYKPIELIPQKISPLKPAEVIRRKHPANRPAGTIQRIEHLPKQNSNPSIYNPPTYNPKSNEREISKLPFIPSKVDPYLRSGVTIASHFDQPTTFKPEHHHFGNLQSNVAYHGNNNDYNIYDNQGEHTSNVYNVYDPQVVPTDSAFNTYNTQGMVANFAANRKESLQSFNRPNLSTKFPFARHPTVDMHTFEQKFQPGRYSPYQRNDDVTGKRADVLYSELNGSLRPPTTYNQGHALPLERQHNMPQQRRRLSRPQRKRPSLLKNFGFFKRRSGVSGPSSDGNSIRTGDPEKESSKYLLTKGPIPYNAQKVTVIGPFKNPPIGAPKVHPHHIPVQGDSLMLTLPSTKLIPPLPFQNPAITNEIDTSNREPSFKVVNFPKEDGLTINQGYTVTADVNNGITNGQKATSDKNIEKSSIIYGQKNIFNNPKFIEANSTIVDVSSKFNVGSDKKDRMAIVPQASALGQYKEVSEADKERIIAAKFVFPRVQAVRRSGFDSHVIPIPVPLLGTAGNQIRQMQSIILPKLPIKRSILLEPQRKFPRRVDTAPLLLTNDPQVSGINQNSNGIFSPTQQTNSKRLTTSKVQSHDSSISEFQNKGTSPSSVNEGNVMINTEKGQTVGKESLVISTSRINPPMNITPYPASSFVNEKSYEQPQSFVEPMNSAIMYGNWKVVGESKVNPKGELDPVVSFVVENTPEILLKKTLEKDVNKKLEISSENEPKLPEIVLGKSKEDEMVKYSSTLNVEGQDSSIKSILVQPQRAD